MGGEFEIDINMVENSVKELPTIFNNGQFYSSGRAALYHILILSKKLGKNKILLPDYLCDSVVNTVKLLNIPFEFYSLNNDLTPNINSFLNKYQSDYSVLIINYFGSIVIDNIIRKIRNIDPAALIVLDNVQAFFSMFNSNDADFMFTSFRKQLPVPDGAWVISKYDGLKQYFEENTFASYKLAAGLLKNFKQYNSILAKQYLLLFEKGEELIGENIHAGISDITIRILNKIDFNLIRRKRKENSDFLVEGIKKLGLRPLVNFNQNQVPLFVPISLQNRDYVRKKLRSNNIFCPIHWPKCEETNSLNQKLYDTELSLVIDQRYDKNDIIKMLNVIKGCLNYEK